MTDRRKECMEYTKRWYLGEIVTTVEMDGSGDALQEQCIQMMVVEMLRDFVDNPIPEGLREGTLDLATWMGAAYKKATRGVDMGLNEEQVNAVINLAFNYWAVGISRTQAEPLLKDRLIQCSRSWPIGRAV